jgi:hypothetical protein
MSTLPEGIQKELSRWKWFFFNQKYRFDLGYQFLALINFILLVITASDKLRYYTNISRTWVLVICAVPFGFAGVWIFGYFLDRVVKYGQAYNLEAVKRNPMWDIQKAQLDRIEAEIKALAARKS